MSGGKARHHRAFDTADLPAYESWINDAPCADSAGEFDLPYATTARELLGLRSVRIALDTCLRCPYTRECDVRVAPRESLYDGIAAGRVWRNGIPVNPELSR